MNKLLAAALCFALPISSWANISNTASVSYKDAANNSYTGNSNTVSITTPPVITSLATATGAVGVAFSYQITATNNPTGYSLGGTLPAGLSMNFTTGLISGTPTSAAAGTTVVSLTASNAAGAGAPLTLTITIGVPNVVLTKTSSVATAQSGNTVTFTINYQNTGTAGASNVTITDVVPAGSTLVAGSITGGGTLSGGAISWTIGAIAAGAATASVSFRVTVN